MAKPSLKTLGEMIEAIADYPAADTSHFLYKVIEAIADREDALISDPSLTEDERDQVRQMFIAKGRFQLGNRVLGHIELLRVLDLEIDLALQQIRPGDTRDNYKGVIIIDPGDIGDPNAVELWHKWEDMDRQRRDGNDTVQT